VAAAGPGPWSNAPMHSPGLPIPSARRLIFLALWLCLVAMVSTYSWSIPVTAATEHDHIVTITKTLDPAHLEVEVGTTMMWRNEDDERHRVRSKEGPVEFDSGDLEPGVTFSHTFAIEGSYPYYDHRDRDDSAYFGMIVVQGSAIAADGPLPDSGVVSIVDRAFRPPTFSIATDGIIEWTNDDGEAHTVTSTDSGFDSGILDSGATFSQAFTQPGDYPYFCLIHPEMRGTISVDDPVDELTPDEPTGDEPGIEETVPEPKLGTEPDAPASSAATLVSTIDRSFQPADVEVAVGDTVLWTNLDTEGHTVTAVDGAFNSGVMTVGDEFSLAFDAAGAFDYFCAIHPEMTGTVTVSEPAR